MSEENAHGDRVAPGDRHEVKDGGGGRRETRLEEQAEKESTDLSPEVSRQCPGTRGQILQFDLHQRPETRVATQFVFVVKETGSNGPVRSSTIYLSYVVMMYVVMYVVMYACFQLVDR